MSNNPADNMYCMVSFADKDGKSHGNHPQILEIQGVVWFATEELAREYYMMLKPELRDNDNVFPMQEEQLSWHFDVNSSYVKHMKTRTRLINQVLLYIQTIIMVHLCLIIMENKYSYEIK